MEPFRTRARRTCWLGAGLLAIAGCAVEADVTGTPAATVETASSQSMPVPARPAAVTAVDAEEAVAAPAEESRVEVLTPVEPEATEAAAPIVPASAEAATAAPSLNPSHEQIATIKFDVKGEKKSSLNTFCVAPDGRVVTAWGKKSEPTEIRVFDGDGALLASWPVEIVPQTVNVAPDGTIFAAGQGKLVKLDPKTGAVLAQADTPQAAAVRAGAEKIKADYLKAIGEQSEQFKELAEAARKREEQLAAKEDPTPADKRMLALAKRQRQMYEQQTGRQAEMNDVQAEAMLENKMAVRGLAVTDRDIFVSCNGVEGHGYDVWRMTHDFGDPKKVVGDLRGCCGNMDIQANAGELYVAENARHRVCRYDRDGNLLASWGKADREENDPNGFGSCCNPMNLRFGEGGEVYTAESNLGRIKRYSPSGEYLGTVGKVKLVPGCKHVAIAVADGGDRVYMLDITRNEIIVMGRKAPGGETLTQQAKPTVGEWFTGLLTGSAKE